MRFIVFLALLLAVVFGALNASAGEKLVLPKGYSTWEKSKQKIVDDKKSLFYGIHYTYVNKKAMKTFKSGGTYPEGSQFVVEFFNIRTEGGKPVQGSKNMVVLMKKDRKQKQTGGWQFAGFGPDGKPSGVDPVKNCYECHLKEAKDTDLVFSKYADFK